MKEEETDEKEPVKVQAFTKKMSNGNRLITIRMKIHPGYRIYTQVDKSAPYLPTTITFVLPKGVEKVGELSSLQDGRIIVPEPLLWKKRRYLLKKFEDGERDLCH